MAHLKKESLTSLLDMEGKIFLIHCMRACRTSGAWVHLFLTLALDGDEDQPHTLATLYLVYCCQIAAGIEEMYSCVEVVCLCIKKKLCNFCSTIKKYAAWWQEMHGRNLPVGWLGLHSSGCSLSRNVVNEEEV